MNKIELKDVWKRFDEKPVFRGVNLEVREGETLVIIGQSGTGKSVMLKHMVGLLRPDRGNVLVDGEEITNLSEDELFAVRRKFGFLFQGAALLDSLTVEQNVGLGLKENTKLSAARIKEIVNRKLALVGMEGSNDYLPADLSGGMRKRVGLARAIAMDPEIILYDEPTTGLDPIIADSINTLIRHLQEELHITSVVVTHDMVSARKVGDRIAMLCGGEIVFTGSIDELDHTASAIVRQFVEGSADGPINTANCASINNHPAQEQKQETPLRT